MKSNIQKIGFGGGCHWCTEAVFQSLLGIEKVEQGFIASEGKEDSFSEAVIVHFDDDLISLKVLTEIHLHTHKSTSQHSMRSKYRSTVYFFESNQEREIQQILNGLQPDFENKIVTKVLPFRNFKESEEMFKNYYYSNPDKPFCETHISPKLSLLLRKFRTVTNQEKIRRKELIR